MESVQGKMQYYHEKTHKASRSVAPRLLTLSSLRCSTNLKENIEVLQPLLHVDAMLEKDEGRKENVHKNKKRAERQRV